MVIAKDDTVGIAHILEEQFSNRFERKDRAAFHLLTNFASRSGIDALNRAHRFLAIEYENIAQHRMLCETTLADTVENDDGSHSVSLTVSEALAIAEPIDAMNFFAANDVERQLRLSHEQIEDAANDLHPRWHSESLRSDGAVIESRRAFLRAFNSLSTVLL